MDQENSIVDLHYTAILHACEISELNTMTICSKGGQFSDLSRFKIVPIKGRAGVLIAQYRNKSFLRPESVRSTTWRAGTDSQLWAFNWSGLRYGARCLERGGMECGVKQRILRSSQGLLPSLGPSLLSSPQHRQTQTGPRLPGSR